MRAAGNWSVDGFVAEQNDILQATGPSVVGALWYLSNCISSGRHLFAVQDGPTGGGEAASNLGLSKLFKRSARDLPKPKKALDDARKEAAQYLADNKAKPRTWRGCRASLATFRSSSKSNKPKQMGRRKMNPFRTPQSGRERLSVLAERDLGDGGSQVELPRKQPRSAVDTRHCRGGMVAQGDSRMRTGGCALCGAATLFEVFGGVKALPMFTATAASTTDYVQLADGGRRFVEVVNELGATKLKAAQECGLQSFEGADRERIPSATDSRDRIAKSEGCSLGACGFGGTTCASSNRFAVSEAKAVVPKAPPPTAALRKVSAETLAFLKSATRRRGGANPQG